MVKHCVAATAIRRLNQHGGENEIGLTFPYKKTNQANTLFKKAAAVKKTTNKTAKKAYSR
jgi:hypothetical protein